MSWQLYPFSIANNGFIYHQKNLQHLSCVLCSHHCISMEEFILALVQQSKLCFLKSDREANFVMFVFRFLKNSPASVLCLGFQFSYSVHKKQQQWEAKLDYWVFKGDDYSVLLKTDKTRKFYSVLSLKVSGHVISYIDLRIMSISTQSALVIIRSDS